MDFSGELSMRAGESYFGVYFPSFEATREINTEITLRWAHKQFLTRVHTLFISTWYNESINDGEMTIFTHGPVSRTLGLCSIDDATIG